MKHVIPFLIPGCLGSASHLSDRAAALAVLARMGRVFNTSPPFAFYV